jgi:serine/threonine-protein kinase HipA
MVSLPIYFETRLVGKIQIGRGGPSFAYDPDWIRLRGAFPISLTMPLRPEPWSAEVFLPWAANLLPENEQLRTLGEILGMARSDVIGLLSTIGGETAGALSFGQPGRTGSFFWRPVGSEDDLERLIEELPSKPFLAGDDGVSMSLAGAQTKLAVAVDSEAKICVPTHGSPSTHILKPDAARLPGGVQNEAFCLTLARRLNITVPVITTGRAGKRTYLLVQRFDRTDKDDRWRRLHQEDFCQALGKPPSAKYESNLTGIDGPTVSDMFDLNRRHLSPTDIVHLLDYVVFNVLACNTDAHAKNYSVMIRASGASLAPMYDVICGAVWGSVTKSFAQKIGGESRADNLDVTHWRRLAHECGLNPKQVFERVGALASLALKESDAAAAEVAAMPAGGHESLDLARQFVERRAHAILAKLRTSEEKPKTATLMCNPIERRTGGSEEHGSRHTTM